MMIFSDFFVIDFEIKFGETESPTGEASRWLCDVEKRVQRTVIGVYRESFVLKIRLRSL